jgi:hypothetical protein
MLDGRYFRESKGATMLGAAQLAWLYERLAASKARFKLLVMGSGWSAESNDDSWGAHLAERDALFAFIRDQNVAGVVLMSGDVHRSEMHQIPGADGGYTMPELVSSPLANHRNRCRSTNEHLAPGGAETCYGEDTGADPSFISVDVDTTLADPELVATIYSDRGTAISTWNIRASSLTKPIRPGLSSGAADFDGDGYADLAIGAPGEDVSRADDGLVQVLYGTTGGLHSRDQLDLSQGPPHTATTGKNLYGSNEPQDRLGASLAHGDFDGDGYTDLAIGIPGEAIGDLEAAGRVAVVYGGASGLTTARNQSFHQDTAGIQGTAAASELFGYALASGDFNGDGQDDLAVGAPRDGGGAVNVIYGSATGLVPDGGDRDDEVFDHTNASAISADEAGDEFGRALAAADFDGDGYTDLAVAAPFEDRTGAPQAGWVRVLYGTAGGLDDGDTNDQGLGIEVFGGSRASGDHSGFALAAADFDGDGYADLAIGAPGRGGGQGRAGVVYGTNAGLSPDRARSWSLADLIDGSSTDGDGLGQALATGDFDGNGIADLAIGVPGRTAGAGLVVVVRALDAVGAGLDDSRSNVLDQAWGIWWSSVEPGAAFGTALAAGDFDGDGRADLAVGAPRKTVGKAAGAGVVEVFFGAPTGFDDDTPSLPGSRYTQRWHQNTPEINDRTEAGDGFGASLSR